MPCYIFPHVPKCGGTSLLQHFQRSPMNVLVDYKAWVGDDAERLNDECAARDFSEYDVIYGHFPIVRYDKPHYRYIALVRDPLDRCASAYKFHKDIGIRQPDNATYDGMLGRRIVNEKLTLLEYIKAVQNIDRVYRHFMGGWSRERFDLIGRVEAYEDFLCDLSRLLGVPFPNEIHARKLDMDVPLSQREAAEARELLAAEYAWFDRFTGAK